MNAKTLKPINHPDPSREFNLYETGFVFIFDVRPFSVYSVQAVGEDTWSTAILSVERSNDGQNPVALETGATTLTSPGMTTALDCTGFGYVHVRLSVLASAAATCKVFVHAKAGE